MRSLLIILSFCLFDPLQIDGTGQSSRQLGRLYRKATEKHGEHITMIRNMAETGETINRILKPLKNGLLGFGSGGFVFRGLRLKDKKPVAIKFMYENKFLNAKREYTTYSYLSAINNSQVEKYGIPTVYYYGEWKNYTVTAYTLLDETLRERSKMTQLTNYDYLFLIRHFIKQSKYIHSQGIRHDDIKPENILLRDCETFLNDFDYASKITHDNRGRTVRFASLRFHQIEHRVPMDDWESYLYSLCAVLEIPLDWFRKDIRDARKNDKEAIFTLIGQLKSNRTKILEIIEQKLNENAILKNVLIAFAEEVFSDKSIPDYDGFDSMVAKILAEYFADRTCFSWITENMANASNNSVREKIKESIKRANTDIDDLVIPEDISEYKSFLYPDVDEEFFNKQSNPIFGCKSTCVQI